MRSVTRLSLGANCLTALSGPQLASYSSLRSLDLSGNAIEALPPTISQLSGGRRSRW